MTEFFILVFAGILVKYLVLGINYTWKKYIDTRKKKKQKNVDFDIDFF